LGWTCVGGVVKKRIGVCDVWIGVLGSENCIVILAKCEVI